MKPLEGLEGLIGAKLESITEIIRKDKAISLQFDNGMNLIVNLPSKQPIGDK